MSKFNDHKKVLFELLCQYCPSVYFQLCPAGTGFPRTEYDFKQLNVSDVPYEKYLLTINCYGKGQAETVDDILDDLIVGLDKYAFDNKNFYYQFYYQNDRQSIQETEKSLKRIMLTFEVRIYARSEM